MLYNHHWSNPKDKIKAFSVSLYLYGNSCFVVENEHILNHFFISLCHNFLTAVLCRRVYKRYTADGRPSEILYDTNHIKYTYDSRTHAMTAVTLDSDVYECVLGYRSNGSLYDKHRVTVNSKLGHLQFADVTYKYKYNK